MFPATQAGRGKRKKAQFVLFQAAGIFISKRMFIGNSQSIFVWRVFCLRGRWQSVNNHLPPPLPLWWLPSGRDRPKTMCFLFLSFSSSFYGRLSKRGDGRMAWNLVAEEERGGTDDRFLWCCCQTEDVTGGMPPKPLPPPPPPPCHTST